jgi:hypothetical protein
MRWILLSFRFVFKAYKASQQGGCNCYAWTYKEGSGDLLFD